MKNILMLLAISYSLLSTSCTEHEGCKDLSANNYDPHAKKDCRNCCIYPINPPVITQPPNVKKGSLLFWTNDPWMIPSCGVITIQLSNGQQANITGYYNAAPANCANYVGGYFYIDEGTYTYEVISGNGLCSIPGGTVTVIGNQCNMHKVQ